MRELTIDLRNAHDFAGFVLAVNEGLCRRVGGEWHGGWDAFHDYLSWPDEPRYRLIFVGWESSSALSPADRAILEEIFADNAHVEVVRA